MRALPWADENDLDVFFLLTVCGDDDQSEFDLDDLPTRALSMMPYDIADGHAIELKREGIGLRLIGLHRADQNC